MTTRKVASYAVRTGVVAALSLAFVAFVGAAGWIVRSSAQESSPGQDSSGRLLSLETMWNQAEVEKDTQSLDHLLADAFVFVDTDGSLRNKPEFLDSVRNRAEHIESIRNDSMISRTYDNVVVVSAVYNEKGTLNGKPYLHRGRFVDTWVRKGGMWLCVASQSTLIQK